MHAGYFTVIFRFYAIIEIFADLSDLGGAEEAVCGKIFGKLMADGDFGFLSEWRRTSVATFAGDVSYNTSSICVLQ